jgi:hypothetical protein
VDGLLRRTDQSVDSWRSSVNLEGSVLSFGWVASFWLLPSFRDGLDEIFSDWASPLAIVSSIFFSPPITLDQNRVNRTYISILLWILPIGGQQRHRIKYLAIAMEPLHAGHRFIFILAFGFFTSHCSLSEAATRRLTLHTQYDDSERSTSL